jgi:hypothetical protein
MHPRVPAARSWTLGAIFAFVAAALVAVFGITPAHAAGVARHAAGPSPAEASSTPWSTSAPAATVTVATADEGEDHAHAQTAAVALTPIRPSGREVRFAVPALAHDRAGTPAVTETWGRAPPA